jgi:hypothetical protein
VHCNLEPATVVRELKRKGQAISLETRDDERRGGGLRFAFEGSSHEVLRPFCDALDRLHTKQSPTAYEREWGHPFPGSSVELLRAILGSA